MVKKILAVKMLITDLVMQKHLNKDPLCNLIWM